MHNWSDRLHLIIKVIHSKCAMSHNYYGFAGLQHMLASNRCVDSCWKNSSKNSKVSSIPVRKQAENLADISTRMLWSSSGEKMSSKQVIMTYVCKWLMQIASRRTLEHSSSPWRRPEHCGWMSSRFLACFLAGIEEPFTVHATASWVVPASLIRFWQTVTSTV